MYRALPVVTQRPKTKCGECCEVWTLSCRVIGCDLTMFTERNYAAEQDALTGVCEHFRPTPWVRLTRWLGLREAEMLTFVDGELSQAPELEEEAERVEIRTNHEVAAVCELGASPPAAPSPRYRLD